MTIDTTIVVARYEEDISWIRGKCFVVQKGEHMPNVGLEPSSYFWYIVNHYNELSGTYLFMQGDPFDHIVSLDEFKPPLICDKDGSPHHSGLDIHGLSKELGIPLRDNYEFVPGCPLRVTAEQIKKHPLSFYEKALELSNTYPQGPWIFERIFKYVFE